MCYSLLFVMSLNLKLNDRCELGDLSGKHGWLVIQSSNSPEETTVATDSNLPLTGHYTGNLNLIAFLL